MKNNNNLFSLKGKTALITGGSSGLGHAIATAFLQAKANVIICARKPYTATDLSDLANELGVHFHSICCDITNSSDVNSMISQIAQEFQTLDILVNSAGINRLCKAEDYDEKTFSQVLDINIKGTFLVTRAVANQFMISQKYGRILNLSSVKGTVGATENYLAYCTSKGAVNMYTKQLACEWGKYQITCNAIAPTFVKTNLNTAQLADTAFYNSIVERIPLGRIGNFEDITCAALYFCSDAAKFVSGQILHIDGGLTALQ